MKNTAKRKSVFVFALAVIAVVLAIIAVLGLNKSAQPASAETYASVDDYKFTLVTDSDGNSSYKAAIQATLRNSVTVAIVPDTYNGLPVTELANNAFMSCKLLTKVVLPKSVTKIGTNAFINCSKLSAVHMPCVESIGATAFSMCTSLDRLYIPKTVKSVGANILKNNASTVFVQSAQEDLGEGWSSTWDKYNTGEVFYSAEPEDSIKYREIYDKNNTNLIGYEICEEQVFSTIEDVEIYKAYRPDENSEYLPVLNICQEAFSAVTLHSLTIKDRPDNDEDFPVFDHAINIRSDAFYFALIDTINIETNVTFDHPTDLEVGRTEGWFVDGEITGDENGHSVGVFEESLMYNLTLPTGIEAICDRMFYNCTNLKSIKIAGQDYDGINRLPDIQSIGDEAFDSCGVLENITIPSTVQSMGSSVFNRWGTCPILDTNQNVQQVINIEQYQKLLFGWNEDWADGIDHDNVTVNYKETYVNIHLCNGTDEYITVSVTPGEQMPEIEIPTYDGHVFKGIFTEQDGNGVQYYTSSGASAREWQEGGPSELYVNWGSNKYRVSLVREGQDPCIIDAFLGQSMPAAPKPEKRGYTFNGYYYLESDGTKTYYYDQDMCSYRDWNRTEDCTLYPDWEIIVYHIEYVNLLNGYNPIDNPTEYTVESETIELINPDRALYGYTGEWDVKVILHGSIGHLKITAIWTPILYKITYVIDEQYINPNAEITRFTVEDEIYLEPPTGRDYYEGRWDRPFILKDTACDLTITAIWLPIYYNIYYEIGTSGRYTNPNPATITAEETVNLQLATRSGYMLICWTLNGVPVSTLKDIHNDITLVAVWSDGMVVNVDSKMTILRVTVNKMTVRLPYTNLSRQQGFTIYVTSGVTELTITADKSTEIYYMNVDLSGATKDFSLNLENVCMTSWSDGPTINIPSHKLILNTTGSCRINGADAKNDSYASFPKSAGGVAISCYSLEIQSADDLVIKGGNGANCYGAGGRATDGGYAVMSGGNGVIAIYTNNVTLIGGNGGNAQYGATLYGHGSEAANKTVYRSTNITVTEGNDGKVV